MERVRKGREKRLSIPSLTISQRLNTVIDTETFLPSFLSFFRDTEARGGKKRFALIDPKGPREGWWWIQAFFLPLH